MTNAMLKKKQLDCFSLGMPSWYTSIQSSRFYNWPKLNWNEYY